MVQQSYVSDREESRSRLEDMPPTSPAENALQRSLTNLRRMWWFVVVVVVLAVVAGVFATTRTPTTYTARSSLIVNSNNRSPDQDAVLVQGYVDYFNDPSYQAQLTKQAGLTSPVGLMARAAAASPILIIESTAKNADLAQSSSSAVAEAFRADINQVIDQGQAAEISSLQKRLDKAVQTSGADTSVAATLQDQIAQVQGDRTNRLQNLQLRGGVATNNPSLKSNVILAGAGGLVLGILGALALGAVTPRSRRRRSRTG